MSAPVLARRLQQIVDAGQFSLKYLHLRPIDRCRRADRQFVFVNRLAFRLSSPRLDCYWVNKAFFCDRVIGCLHRQAAPLKRLDMDDGEVTADAPGPVWRRDAWSCVD